MSPDSRQVIRRMLTESQPVTIHVGSNRGRIPTVVYPKSPRGEVPESWPPVEAFLKENFKTEPYVHQPALWVHAPTKEVREALQQNGFPVEDKSDV